MISCPAAKQMRCVKPSIATVSPSRTSSAIASRIDATFEVAHRPWPVARRARRSAGGLALVERAGVGTSARTSAPCPATCATASPKIRSAVAISASVTVSAGDIRTLDLPHSRTSRPRSKQAHWTASACSADVELDAEHQALAADVADEAVEALDERPRARPAPARRAPRRCR